MIFMVFIEHEVMSAMSIVFDLNVECTWLFFRTIYQERNFILLYP